MRKFYANFVCVMLALLCLGQGLVSYAQTQTVSVPVTPGTTTMASLPISTNYGYNYSQQIILGTEMVAGGTSGGEISKIRFYYSASGSFNSTNNLWTVSLVNSTKTEFTSTSDWVPLADLQEVFSGVVTPVAGGWFEMNFTTPFVYTGGNLVVAVHENTVGYTTPGANFGSFTATNRGLYYRSDATPFNVTTPQAGSRASTINTMQFEVTPFSCPIPSSLVIQGLTANNTTLNWTEEGTATTWEIAWGTPGFTVNGSGQLGGNVANNTATVQMTGLQEATTYEVRVRANCGGEQSLWSAGLVFTTPQIPVALPFTESFDNAGWMLENGTQVNKWFIGSATGNPANSLYISNNEGVANAYTGTTAATVYAHKTFTLPAGNISRLMFSRKGNGDTSDRLRVYVMSATTNVTAGTAIVAGNGITQLGGNLFGAANWTNETFDLPAALAGTDVKIVFEWANNATTTTQVPVAIDNVQLIQINCLQPTAFAAANITNSSVDLSWTDNNNATEWEIVFGPTGFHPSTGTATGTLTTQVPSLTIPGLAEGQNYVFYVRSMCTNDGANEWSVALNVTIPQTPVNLPYQTDFAVNDWMFTNGTGVNVWSNGSATGNPANAMYISNDNGVTNNYTQSTTAYAVFASKTVNIPTGAATKINFEWKADAEGIHDNGQLWIVPATTILVPGTAITTTNTNGAIQLGGNFSEHNTGWKLESFSIPASFVGTTANIVFQWKNDGSGGQNPAIAIDNVHIFQDNCPTVTGLTAVLQTGTTDVQLTWNSTNATSYDIVWGSVGFNPNTDVPAGTMQTSDTTMLIPSLANGTTYNFYVKGLCQPGDVTSFSSIATVSTPQLPVDLPYTDDFSNINWMLSNAGPNSWFIGATAGNPANGLYVTNNNGVSNAYTHTISRAYATKLFNIPTGDLSRLSFDWSIDGESSFDNLQVWVFPENATLPTGTANITTTTVPGAVQLGGNFSEGIAWTTETLDIPAQFQGQTIKIVLAWKNDGGGGDAPAIVDNFSMVQIDCIEPSVLSAEPIHNGALASWTSVAGSLGYVVSYGLDGFEAGSAAQIGTATVTDTFFNITNLVPSTDYTVYVQNQCAAGISSEWIAFDFSTLCDVVVAPYVQDFNAGALPTCFLNSSSNPVAVGLWKFAGTVDYAPGNTRPVGTFAWVDGSTPVVNDVTLTSPLVDVSALTTPAFKFDYFSNRTNTALLNNTFKVEFRELGGAWQPLYTNATSEGDWRELEFPFPTLTGTILQVRIIVDKSTSGSNSYTNDILFDNFVIDNVTLCFKPQDVVVSAIGSDNATVSWTPGNGETTFNVAWGTQGFVVGDANQIASTTVTDTLFVIPGLTELSNYSVYVQADCGADGPGAWTAITNFTTTQIPANIPFTEDFTVPSSWNIINGTALNQWHIGSATAVDSAGQALYISNDNGVANAYTISGTGAATAVWATKVFNIPTGNSSYLSFDWRNQGESNSDRIRVYAMPAATVLPAVGTQITAANTPSAVILHTDILSLSATWNNARYMVPAQFAGTTMKLVFEWRNDGTVGVQPPAAIDNVVIEQEICATPLDVVVSPTSSSATVTWTSLTTPESGWNIVWGPEGFEPGDTTQLGTATVTSIPFEITGLNDNTSYVVFVQGNCDTAGVSAWAEEVNFSTTCLPMAAIGYCNDFEAANSLDCWTIINNNNDADKWLRGTTSTYAQSGTAYASMYTDLNASDDDYLVMPKMILTGNEVLKFGFRGRSTTEPNSFRVVVSTTGLLPSDFTHVVHEDTTTIAYQNVTIDLSAFNTEAYIAFHVPLGALDGYYLYIDDVCIDVCVPVPTPDATAEVCKMEETIDLNTVINSDYTHGTWSYQYDSTLVTGSTFNFSTLVDGDYELFYIVEGGCTSDTTIATITVRTASNGGESTVTSVCRNQAVDLATLVSVNADQGGAFLNTDGSLMTTTNVTTPNWPGQYTYKYVVTSGACLADTVNLTLNVGNCNVLGLDGNDEVGSISIAPNPTNGMFQILGITAENITIEVVDVTGKVVMASKTVKATANKVDLSSFENGVYLVNITSGTSTKMIRVVKQN